jgi:hypothetical protein
LGTRFPNGSLVFGNGESAREGQNVRKNRHMGCPIGITGLPNGQRPGNLDIGKMKNSQKIVQND